MATYSWQLPGPPVIPPGGGSGGGGPGSSGGLSSPPTQPQLAAPGILDQLVDPLTLDYVRSTEGGWIETADSRAIMMCQIELELGASFTTPGDGTRIREMLRTGEPVTPAMVASECVRAARVLEAAGVIQRFSIEVLDELGLPRVDDRGRLTPILRWTDLASGTPVDLVYTPRGG